MFKSELKYDLGAQRYRGPICEGLSCQKSPQKLIRELTRKLTSRLNSWFPLGAIIAGLLMCAMAIGVKNASAQTLLAECGRGFVKAITPHDQDIGVGASCSQVKLVFRASGKVKEATLARANMKFGNKNFKAADLIKSQCRQDQGGSAPYVMGKNLVVVDPACLNVRKKVNKKSTGTLDLAKFLENLNSLRQSLISSGLPAASADQLIEMIKGLVNSSIVQATPTPTATVAAVKPVGTATPTSTPIVQPLPPVITLAPTATASSGVACQGVVVDSSSYPCRDGAMYSVIWYPLSCDYSARPQCPSGYSEVNRVCLNSNQCQINCRKSCSACAAGQFKDDTTSYACNGSVEYTIRYYPASCQASCPTGFQADYQGCKSSGECQINCKRSCSGTTPVTVTPTTTPTATPTATPTRAVAPVPGAPAPVVPAPGVPAPGAVVNRCDSKYVLVNGACKFGMQGSNCIAASVSNLNVGDSSTICINQSGTMLPFQPCTDSQNLGKNCAPGQGRDQRCSETDFRDNPYIASFTHGSGGGSGLQGVYCCSQPSVGGGQPPAPGVVCKLLSNEDKFDKSIPVPDQSQLQPVQKRDCSQGGEASGLKNCGATQANPYGNGTCGWDVVFGATKAMSAPVVNDGGCCSGRANYVSHIIGGNQGGRKGEHANYACCGADGEPACNG